MAYKRVNKRLLVQAQVKSTPTCEGAHKPPRKVFEMGSKLMAVCDVCGVVQPLDKGGTVRLHTQGKDNN